MRIILKIIVISINAIILCVFLYFSVREGVPPFWWSLVIFGVPIINILALLLVPVKDNWIGLYFERKALEEKKKIMKIEEELKYTHERKN